MASYEISLWEDYLDPSTPDHFLERKIAVIGADTMTAQFRAINPRLVRNKNGTNTFTFSIYYRYVDNETGLEVENPFFKALKDESKIKVHWKKKWYDLVLKKVSEDSANHIANYSCTDLFINELSKNGFNLEFNTELENSIGNLNFFANAIADGTDWKYDAANSSTLLEKSKDSLYAVNTLVSFSAQNISSSSSVTIASNKTLYIFYEDASAREPLVQFIYTGTDPLVFDENDIVIKNENCNYLIDGITWIPQSKDGEPDVILEAYKNNTKIFEIDRSAISDYQAYKFVRSQKQIYEPLLSRYVGIYKKNNIEYRGFQTTDYQNPDVVGNLFTNAKDFSNLEGWHKVSGDADFTWTIYPWPNAQQSWDSYTGRAYLKVNGQIHNKGLRSNLTYLPGGLIKGTKYIFRYKAVSDNEGNPNPSSYISSGITLKILPYNTTTFAPTSTSSLITFGTSGRDGDWVTMTGTATQSISIEELKTGAAGFFIDVSTNTYWIEDIQFYKRVEAAPIILEYYSDTTYEENTIINTGSAQNYRCIRESKGHMPPNSTYFEAYSNSTIVCTPGSYSAIAVQQDYYKFYIPSTEYKSADDIVYETATDLTEFVPVYETDDSPLYEKVRTIVASKTNRFNLLQTVAEKFECWIKFNIQHNESTGEIIWLENENRYAKSFSFVEKLGENQGLAFTYGIDLNSITRTIDSEKIVTKTIVSPNTTELADSGICTIATAFNNYPKTSYLLDFGYYINNGFLTYGGVNADLYLAPNGYFWKLHQYNSALEDIESKLINSRAYKLKLEALDTTVGNALSAAYEIETESKSAIIRMAGFGDTSAKTIDQAIAKLDAQFPNSDEVKKLYTALTNAQKQTKYYGAQHELIATSLTDVINQIDDLKEQQEDYIELIEEADAQFFKKYSRYILEGTWTPNDYYDANKFYLDAKSVAYTSSRPQVSYNISVARISEDPEFSRRQFNLGDIYYIEDTKFFGYKSDRITPYKEEVLISEVIENFDSPQSDSFVVQNYKTQYEDLFQRINATTESLQYNEGSYRNAAAAIEPDGSITYESLQHAIQTNEQLVYASLNDTIYEDSTGLTVSDMANPANKTKITSKGIFITTDGGVTWKNAIRGSGIATQYLTSGTVNTSYINIMNGDFPTFKWNKNGISAYKFDEDGIYSNQFVRYDQYGIYGLDNYIENESPSIDEDYIWDTAKFGLTWRGFFLKNGNESSRIEISTENDISVIQNELIRVKIGRLSGLDGNYVYGIQLNNSEGNPVLITDTNGDIKLQNCLYINASSNLRITLGDSGIYDGEPIQSIDTENLHMIMNVGNGGDTNAGNFIVWEDGSILARNGVFTGEIHALSGEFSGTIAANDGKIGGWTINGNTLQSESIEGAPPRVILDAANGSIMGNIIATEGSVGGIRIQDGGLSTVDTSGRGVTINSDGINISDGGLVITSGQGDNLKRVLYFDESGALVFNGKIEAFDISSYRGVIGGWTIEDQQLYSQSGDVILRGDLSSNSYFLEAGALRATNTGRIELGNITLDGSGSTSEIFGNGFYITQDEAFFNRLSIENAIFVSNQTQAMGGTILFNPTFKIASMDDTHIVLHENSGWALTDSGDFVQECICYLTREGSFDPIIVSISGASIHDNVVTLSYTTTQSSIDFDYNAIIYLGQSENSYVISMNNSPLSTNRLFPNGGLTFSTFTYDDGSSSNDIITAESINYKHHLFLGNLHDFEPWRQDGYGLYADNVNLCGSLVTGYDSENRYAGINTRDSVSFPYGRASELFDIGTEDESPIVFWSGALTDSDYDIANTSTFLVSENGTLYAQRAYIEGSIITKSTLKAAEIYTAAIRGYELNSTQPAELKIYDTSNGIGFYKTYGNVDLKTFSMNTNGLVSYGYDSDNSIYTPYQIIDLELDSTGEYTGNITINANYLKTDRGLISNMLLENSSIKYLENNVVLNPQLLFSQDNLKVNFLQSYVEFHDTVTTFYNGNIVFLQNNGTSMKYQPVTGGYNLYVEAS